MAEIATRLVPVTVETRIGPVDLVGETTDCAHLLITPTVAEGRYAGAYTLTHVPTGRALCPGMEQLVTTLPGLRAVATALAGLDWSSPDPALYAAGTPHGAALKTSLRAAADIEEAMGDA